MRALSQSEYGEIRSLYESIYAPQVDEELELSDEELEDIVEEVVSDLLEEGYDIDDIEEGFNDYIEEDFQFLNEARAARRARKGSKSYDEVKAEQDAKEAERKARKEAKKKPASTGMGATKTSIPSIPSTKKSPEKKSIASRLKGAVKRVVGGKKGAERVTASDRYQKSTRMSPVRAQKNSRVTIGSEDERDLAKRKAERTQNRIDKKIKSAQGDSSKSLKARVSTGVKKATDTAKRVKAGAQIAGIIAKGSAQNAQDSAVRAKRRAELAGSKAVTAVKNAPGNIKKGIKSRIASGLQKVSDRAGSAAKRMSEEVETYDVVVEFLCDYGIAEDLQEAEWLMVNEIDSEDIENILEAYGIDEAQQIMSVSKGGKQIYKAPRSEPSNEPSPHKKRRMQQLKRAQKNADRRGGDSSPARNRAFDRWVSGTDTPFNRTRTSNIKKLNAPTEPNRSNSDDPYRTVQTDYSARRRRASGS